MADVPLYIVSESASGERRISPSWTLTELRSKLERITGIPPGAQELYLLPRTGGGVPASGEDARVYLRATDEDATRVESFPLEPFAELHVLDTRPPSARLNLDASSVEKFVLPDEDYEQRSDSVLAWKKSAKLGRFDPAAPAHARARIDAHEKEALRRGVSVGRRCRVVEVGGGEAATRGRADEGRRGEVMYLGDVPEIPAPGGAGWWVGVRLDEPVGRNDGAIAGKRYWPAEAGGSQLKHGVFVRPERVHVGDFPPLDDLELDEDMEEI